MTAARADALVLFGITGDLAFKKIFPALAAMIRRGHLDMPIVGVARSGWSLPQLRERALASLAQHGGVDPQTSAKLCAQLRYVDGNYEDQATYGKLRQALQSAQRPLYYLAIPPSIFAKVASGLAESGGTQGARVVVEKPFGRDLKSAKELNRTLLACFPEEAIFRIDHYLGKEPVQNLLYFRAANPAVEASWDRAHLASVQLTMAETLGVEGRGKFYEEAGAIRDVVQNHMLQVIACLAMEFPAGSGQEALRDERARLLKQVRTLTPADVVRGQFRGYRAEDGVAPESQVETFAAVRFWVDSPRWRGVPFFVRAGKSLPVSATEVLLRFKRQRQPALQDLDAPPPNHYRFLLSPDVVIALGAQVKRAGELMVGESTELVACHRPADEMEPYERLLTDAANGNPVLFAREDSVEEAWRIVDPVLADPPPVHSYEPGTWGPPEADALMPEGGWQAPTLKPKGECK